MSINKFILIVLLALPVSGQIGNGNGRISDEAVQTRVALLEQEQGRQEQHIEYQDRLLEQIRNQLAENKNDMAQLRGVGLGAITLLSFLSGLQVVLSLKRKKES